MKDRFPVTNTKKLKKKKNVYLFFFLDGQIERFSPTRFFPFGFLRTKNNVIHEESKC